MGFDGQNLYGVVLAGGFGTRLWPLSRRARPKQFIEVIGGERTLLQQTVDRVAGLLPVDRLLVITAGQFVDDIAAQLPELPTRNIIAEPAARGTAPAMGLAAALIKARNPDAVVVNLPCDHYIAEADRFRATVLAAAHAVNDHPVITVVGVEPTAPNTGLGYLELGTDVITVDERTSEGPERTKKTAPTEPTKPTEETERTEGTKPTEETEQTGERRVVKVARFTEKPDEATARAFVSSGRYLWNANYYTFHVDTFLASLAEHAPGLHRLLAPVIAAEAAEDDAIRQAAIETLYAQTQTVPVDTAVAEKATNIYAIAADFGWSDIGNWDELHAVLSRGGTDGRGNVVLSPKPQLVIRVDAANNLVFQTTHRPVGLVGVSDSVVVDLDDALLVAQRDQIQDIKRIVDRLTATDASYC